MKEIANSATTIRRRPGVAHAACVVVFVLGAASGGWAQDSGIARILTLKEAVRLAVGNSRDLALARLQYGVVQREAGVASSPFHPNFYAGTGVAYTNGFPLMS